MTEAREISAEDRLPELRNRLRIFSSLGAEDCNLLFSVIATKQAALEAASARAEEAEGMLKDADEHVARLTTEKVQQFARAAAAEAENERLRDLLKTARDTKWTCGQCGHEEGFYDFKSIIDQALAPAPAIAPPPAPAPEPSEDRDTYPAVSKLGGDVALAIDGLIDAKSAEDWGARRSDAMERLGVMIDRLRGRG